MISLVDKKLTIIYPQNSTEEEIQGLIQTIKDLDLNNIDSILLLNAEIAMSLLFYFKELITTRLNITLYVRENIADILINNFEEIFNTNNLKVHYE